MYKSLVGFPRSLEAIRVPFSAPVFGPRQRIPRPSFQGPRLFLAPHFFNRAGTVCPPTLSRETSPDTPAPRDPPETATRDTSPTALRETTSPIPPRRHPSARRPSPTPPPRYPTARALPRRAGDQIPISRRHVGPTTGCHEGLARLSGKLSVAILGASGVSRHPYIWVVPASMSSLLPSKLATDGSNCILGGCS
jgi:hypothetical protein